MLPGRQNAEPNSRHEQEQPLPALDTKRRAPNEKEKNCPQPQVTPRAASEMSIGFPVRVQAVSDAVDRKLPPRRLGNR